MRWTTDKIRQSFLDFFEEKKHRIAPSAPLIPKGDPTLLFVNAGMVPFKDYFLGVRTPPAPRVADCQKCLRISGKHNDLDAVGRDSYHHTFFEMLGNWSFGDYYKREAIAWHWELVTKVWGIPANLLYATIYKDDGEAEAAWQAIPNLLPGRILRFGEKDNFWEMGETGPCGPCSEIHIDRGAAASRQCPHPMGECGVNVDGCARYIELGNLVFIQYNRDAAGKLTPLPMKHVDTGTGLERVAAVLQSLETGKLLGNYDIDLFREIIKCIESFTAFKYGDKQDKDVSFRAIADHSRAIVFLLSDGLRPGRDGREYVLRRLIRRAVWHRHRLGAGSPELLLSTMEKVIEVMKGAYPDLTALIDSTKNRLRDDTVWREQNQFDSTVQQGNQDVTFMMDTLRRRGQTVFPGEWAFQLHDTRGFPIDLTQDIVGDQGFIVDMAGFDRLMEEQRERGRAARKEEIAPELIIAGGVKSRFVGERRYEAESEILAANDAGDSRIAIVTAETPFYAESGGQVGDRGIIETESGALVEIDDTRKHDGAILHVGRILQGAAGDFERGKRVKLKIDRARRDAAMLNHSATHILHYALRDIVGAEVHQAGSLVAPERLRFDFSHNGPVGEGDLATIEEEINARIRENAAVTTDEMAYAAALKTGALAFFGDKYGDIVRVVRMGDFSTELCGGTHVARTGDIGFFKLESEGGVAAGVRRIEAFTGQGALESIRRREKILEELGRSLGARDSAALDRLEKLMAREKELEKKLRALEQKLVAGAGGDAERVREANGVKIVTRKVEGVEAKALRELADRMRQKHGSAVVGIGSDLGEGKAALIVAVTADLTGKIKAGEVIQRIAPIIGGTGGGRPDFAQAGGRDASRLDEALDQIAALVLAN